MNSLRIFINLFIALTLFAASRGETAAPIPENIRFIQAFSAGLSKPVDVAVSNSGTEIYVVDEETSQIVIFEPDGTVRLNFGEKGTKPAQLNNPHSIAVSPTDKIIVADTGNHRLQVFNKAGEFISQFGSPGSLPGQLNSPVGIVIDQFGFIFVADTGNRRVEIFSPNGVFLGMFDTEFRPVDIGVDVQRNIYVLLPEAGKIVKYSVSGRKLQEISGVVNKRNYLSQANGLAVDMRGDIYVTESAEQSIKKIDKDNVVLLSFGSAGDGRGQFAEAVGVASDTLGQIFIADAKNKRVQILKITGGKKNFIPAVANSPPVVDFDLVRNAEEGLVDLVSVPGRGLFALSDKAAHFLWYSSANNVFGKEGKNPGEFKKPMALSVTLDGRIFVADTGNHRLQIFNAEGSLQYEFGKNGTRAGQFSSPQGVAVNSKGKILVADTQNNRIQIFSHDGIYLTAFGGKSEEPFLPGSEIELRLPKALAVDSKDQIYVLAPESNKIYIFGEEGKFLAALGEKGNDPGQFDRPVDITLDENDNLYVADAGNHRIQIFDPKRRFILTFGSFGKEFGSFESLSAVATSEGRIFVADYKNQQVEIFRYFPDGLLKVERIYATKTAYPSDDPESNDMTKYALAQEAAARAAIKELMTSFSIREEYLKQFVKIESVETL
ncbi:MAG: hypothetical protein A2787_07185, partial [Omnitrophica WOR_2 bacterium RIFCSPHIGHO2_01_FULL_48_9]